VILATVVLVVAAFTNNHNKYCTEIGIDCTIALPLPHGHYLMAITTITIIVAAAAVVVVVHRHHHRHHRLSLS
jgi:hypothetical protein